MLGSENWEDDIDTLLYLVKELYGKCENNSDDPGQLQCQPSAVDSIFGVGGRAGKLGKSGISNVRVRAILL